MTKMPDSPEPPVAAAAVDRAAEPLRTEPNVTAHARYTHAGRRNKLRRTDSRHGPGHATAQESSSHAAHKPHHPRIAALNADVQSYTTQTLLHTRGTDSSQSQLHVSDAEHDHGSGAPALHVRKQTHANTAASHKGKPAEQAQAPKLPASDGAPVP